MSELIDSVTCGTGCEKFYGDEPEIDLDQYDCEGDEPEADEADGDFEREDDGLSDVEADAMTLASAGYGTDEDYGDYGQNDCEW